MMNSVVSDEDESFSYLIENFPSWLIFHFQDCISILTLKPYLRAVIVAIQTPRS